MIEVLRSTEEVFRDSLNIHIHISLPRNQTIMCRTIPYCICTCGIKAYGTVPYSIQDTFVSYVPVRVSPREEKRCKRATSPWDKILCWFGYMIEDKTEVCYNGS